MRPGGQRLKEKEILILHPPRRRRRRIRRRAKEKILGYGHHISHFRIPHGYATDVASEYRWHDVKCVFPKFDNSSVRNCNKIRVPAACNLAQRRMWHENCRVGNRKWVGWPGKKHFKVFLKVLTSPRHRCSQLRKRGGKTAECSVPWVFSGERLWLADRHCI